MKWRRCEDQGQDRVSSSKFELRIRGPLRRGWVDGWMSKSGHVLEEFSGPKDAIPQSRYLV